MEQQKCIVLRLEEKEAELKKEYAKLHERYTDVSDVNFVVVVVDQRRLE